MSDQAAVQRVGDWWANLDPTVKSMFEQIFAEQPELAVRVLSGGSVTAPEGTATLDSLFGGSDGSATTVSPAYAVEQVTVEPAYPDPGTGFDVIYVVRNLGTDAPAPRNDEVRIVDGSRNVVAQQALTGLELPSQQSEGMTASFPQGMGADGLYSVEIWANVDGGPLGGPANEFGTQAASGAALQVGAYAGPVGPDTAGQAFQDAARILEDEASVAQASSFTARDHHEPFLQVGRRVQTMLEAAKHDHPDWKSGDDLSLRVTSLVNQIEHVRLDDVNWDGAGAQEAAMNLRQATLPFSTMPYTSALLDDYVRPLVDAIHEMAGYYYR